MRYLWAVLCETLWSLVPVCSYTLRSQLDLFISFVNNLAKSEVSYFDLAIMEYNVLRLQIIVDYLLVRVI